MVELASFVFFRLFTDEWKKKIGESYDVLKARIEEDLLVKDANQLNELQLACRFVHQSGMGSCHFLS